MHSSTTHQQHTHTQQRSSDIIRIQLKLNHKGSRTADHIPQMLKLMCFYKRLANTKSRNRATLADLCILHLASALFFQAQAPSAYSDNMSHSVYSFKYKSQSTTIQCYSLAFKTMLQSRAEDICDEEILGFDEAVADLRARDSTRSRTAYFSEEDRRAAGNARAAAFSRDYQQQVALQRHYEIYTTSLPPDIRCYILFCSSLPARPLSVIRVQLYYKSARFLYQSAERWFNHYSVLPSLARAVVLILS